MLKPFSELSRSFSDTLAYRFSNFFRSPNFTVAKFSFTLKKISRVSFVSRCLIFKVRCPLFKASCGPLLRFVFAPLEECLDIISPQEPFVKHFFQIFLIFFQLFYQSQYIVVVHIEQPQFLWLKPCKKNEYSVFKWKNY